jgi:uncharacterized protein (DUF1697 family)
VARKLVALLRGINVGKAKRIAMADLRALVEGLGYCDVRTLLNSGNVVFTAARAAPATAAARIEKALVAAVGVAARVTVVTAEELTEAVAENPLREVAADPSRMLVAFFRDAADRPKLEPLLGQDWAPEALALGKGVVYLWCANGILESRLAEAVNRLLGDGVTARNWATVLKLHARSEPEA